MAILVYFNKKEKMKFLKLLLSIFISVISLKAHAQFRPLFNLTSSTDKIDQRTIIDRSSEHFKELNAIGGVSRDANQIIGTGFLISPCHVLTNIHVAFIDPLQARDGSLVYFSVGQTGSLMRPFKENNISGEVVAHGKYDGTYLTANEDWVVVRLSKPVGKSFGYFPLMQGSASAVENLSVLTAGFPAVKTEQQGFANIWADLQCHILGVTIYGYASHTCQTSGGQSGSPILTKGMDGRLYAAGMIQGVHGSHPMRGLDRSKEIENANISVSFYLGANSQSTASTSSGERIKTALESYKCNQ